MKRSYFAPPPFTPSPSPFPLPSRLTCTSIYASVLAVLSSPPWHSSSTFSYQPSLASPCLHHHGFCALVTPRQAKWPCGRSLLSRPVRGGVVNDVLPGRDYAQPAQEVTPRATWYSYPRKSAATWQIPMAHIHDMEGKIRFVHPTWLLLFFFSGLIILAPVHPTNTVAL